MEEENNMEAIFKHEEEALKNGVLDSVVPSCQDCFYSKGGKHSCDRHLNKVKPDYSKGVECYYNNFAHFKPYKA